MQRAKHAEAIVEERAKALDVLQAAEAKYARMLEEASEELADANRRIDFFWLYPCEVRMVDGKPAIRMRSSRQDRGDFDGNLSMMTAVPEEKPEDYLGYKRQVVMEEPALRTSAEVEAVVQKKIAELESGDPDD